MIQVRLLTQQQKDLLISQEFSEYSYFNPIQDINDNWIISEQEVEQCNNPEFLWVKDLPIIDFEPKQYNF